MLVPAIVDFFYGGNTAQVNCEGTITQLLFTNFWIGSIVLIIFFNSLVFIKPTINSV